MTRLSESRPFSWRRSVLLAATAALTSTSAEALSCLRPDAVRLFEMARDAPESYYVVAGRLSFLEPPNTPLPHGKAPTQTRAQLTGSALAKTGFDAQFDSEIRVEAQCLGPWCPDLDSLSRKMILAVEVTETGPVVMIGPCGGDVVPWDAEGEERLLMCYRSGTCETAKY